MGFPLLQLSICPQDCGNSLSYWVVCLATGNAHLGNWCGEGFGCGLRFDPWNGFSNSSWVNSCSGCGLVTFLYICHQASQDHHRGPRWSRRLSGGQPIVLPHRIAVAWFQPSFPHGHLNPQFWWSRSTSVPRPVGRRVYPV